MSKTAEQLRNEISKDLFDFEVNGKIYTIAASEIINKILDAVVESMLEYNGKDSKMNYLQVVNKLRPSK